MVLVWGFGVGVHRIYKSGWGPGSHALTRTAGPAQQRCPTAATGRHDSQGNQGFGGFVRCLCLQARVLGLYRQGAKFRLRRQVARPGITPRNKGVSFDQKRGGWVGLPGRDALPITPPTFPSFDQAQPLIAQ